MPKFSVIIPTFDHGRLIEYPILSILNQTNKSWELFVIFDGSAKSDIEYIRKRFGSDKRINLVEREKDISRGEVYRHEVLTKMASGKYVAYLCDDDLWFADHLEVLEKKFKDGYDFVGSLTTNFDANNHVGFFAGDLSLDYFKKYILSGKNFLSLSCGAHTLQSYKKLPFGWRTTPKGVWTDMYMWQQFLEQSWLKPITNHCLTVLHVSDPSRKHLSIDKRCKELAGYLERIKNDPFGFKLEVLENMNKQLALVDRDKNLYFEEKEGYLYKVQKLEALLNSKFGFFLKAYFKWKGVQ